MKKRLLAFVLCLICCLPCAVLAQSTEDVIRQLLAQSTAQPMQEHSGLTVDFDLLRSLSPDCVGWIYQAESGLNRPVMQSEDDGWYRERAFDGFKIYQTGSAFIDPQASLADSLVVLRGMARTDGGCLSMIPEWEDAQLAAQRTPFVLLTPDGEYQAEPFACLRMEQREVKDWYPPQSPDEFDAWLNSVAQSSLIPAQTLPNANDRLLFVAAEHRNGSCTLLMTRLTEGTDIAHESHDLTKLPLDSMETQNGFVNVGPLGPLMHYAQNDPLFAQMRYESGKVDVYRDFEGGGCGPTAAAIIVANLLDKAELPMIGQAAKAEWGNLFCACSVNRLYCNHTHVPYRLQTPDEYLRYLPVAIADFAAGNNIWDVNSRRVGSVGTNFRFMEYVCQAYNLSYTPIANREDGLTYLQENNGMIFAAALKGSPFTNSSHFVVIAGMDEEYFYVLDPWRRSQEDYLKTDKRELVEILTPGVARIRLEHYNKSDLSPVAYICRAE